MLIEVVEGLDGARTATGTVVVIDVFRAFTTAAYAFAAGLSEIELVSSVEEALAVPGFRMGEVGGRLIPGFDHNNSPSQLIGRKLEGLGVQRTGAGTRCVMAATGASELWLASLVVASATARALAGHDRVTLVASGRPDEGEEDVACAEWISAALKGIRPATEPVIAAVLNSRAAEKHASGDLDLPLEDLPCVTAFDAFPFAMRAERREGRVFARPYYQT